MSKYTVKAVDVAHFKAGNGHAVIDQDGECLAVFARPADAFDWIDREDATAAAHKAAQRQPKIQTLSEMEAEDPDVFKNKD